MANKHPFGTALLTSTLLVPSGNALAQQNQVPSPGDTAAHSQTQSHTHHGKKDHHKSDNLEKPRTPSEEASYRAWQETMRSRGELSTVTPAQGDDYASPSSGAGNVQMLHDGSVLSADADGTLRTAPGKAPTQAADTSGNQDTQWRNRSQIAQTDPSQKSKPPQR